MSAKCFMNVGSGVGGLDVMDVLYQCCYVVF